MIRHFLKRDIRDYQVYWFMVGILSFIFLLLFWITDWIVYLYLAAYACIFLAFLPVNYLTGVTWRAQHVMSRNYLLALPVSRKGLFHTILVRILVFWIPLWSLMLYMPLELNRTIPYQLQHFGPYLLLVPATSFWLVNAIIGMQLRYETITRYMDQNERIRAWIKMLSRTILESSVMVLAVLALYDRRALPAWITVALVLATAFGRYRANLAKWL
jgi:hypothetical protein